MQLLFCGGHRDLRHLAIAGSNSRLRPKRCSGCHGSCKPRQIEGARSRGASGCNKCWQIQADCFNLVANHSVAPGSFSVLLFCLGVHFQAQVQHRAFPHPFGQVLLGEANRHFVIAYQEHCCLTSDPVHYGPHKTFPLTDCTPRTRHIRPFAPVPCCQSKSAWRA